ncbi:MAG: protein kinase [Myxococcales bacterium]|nr:protein kinase [Myxococcales bacterium]MCB9626377.1 protein kinase [Sandaracinaceae bacterium]
MSRQRGFELPPGRIFGDRYSVVQKLGAGSEGEVYQIKERSTGVHRAAKLFFREPAEADKQVVWSARKLDKLQHCPIVLHYHHTMRVDVRGQSVLCLISDLFDGVRLETFIMDQRGGRLHPFMALTLLHSIARGLERIHAVGEYHGDVHTQNILVQQTGIHLNIRLLDFYDRGRPSQRLRRNDLVDAVRVLYQCVGGRKHYSKAGEHIRYICAGMQASLIQRRFPDMSALRNHLESFEWPA